MKPVYRICFGILCLTIGGAIFGSSFDRWGRGAATEGWAAAPGAITRSEVIERRRRAEKGREYATFAAEVVYQYHVAGSTFQGSQLFSAKEGTYEKRARETVERLPVGREVQVIYNPEQPSQAVLALSVRPEESLRGMVLGGVIFGSGLLLLSSLISRRRKSA